jgi:aspartate 1-decarboxylase
MRTMLQAKIHRATVTDACLEYEGSITIDPVLLEAAGMVEYEQVHVLDIQNGERFVTYIILGKPGSGDIIINGAAARRVAIGDKVIIITFATLTAEEMKTHKPHIVWVDEKNHISRSNTH